MAESPIALVTGAASGIGRATANALNAAGHRLVLVDRDPAGVQAAAAALGRGAEAVTLDVTDLGAVRQAMAGLLDRRGPIETVAAIAGISGEGKRFEDISERDFDAMFAVNSRGHFFLLQALVPAMKRLGRGAIVLTSSMFALTGWHTAAHYTAAKGAMLALSKALALELGPFGIRVNAIAPGLIRTPMTERAYTKDNPIFAERAAKVPLRRLTTADEVAATVAYLASPAASSLTGQCLSPSSGEALTD